MTKCVSGFRPVPHPRLVPHDITFAPSPSGAVHLRVVATIECERRCQVLSLDECRFCPRFARIDVHEAGYTMLCRSTDEELGPSEGEAEPDWRANEDNGSHALQCGRPPRLRA